MKTLVILIAVVSVSSCYRPTDYDREFCLNALRTHADSDIISKCVYAGHLTLKDAKL